MNCGALKRKMNEEGEKNLGNYGKNNSKGKKLSFLVAC